MAEHQVSMIVHSQARMPHTVRAFPFTELGTCGYFEYLYIMNNSIFGNYYQVNWIGGRLLGLAQKCITFMVRLTWNLTFQLHTQNRKPQMPSQCSGPPLLHQTLRFLRALRYISFLRSLPLRTALVETGGPHPVFSTHLPPS